MSREWLSEMNILVLVPFLNFTNPVVSRYPWEIGSRAPLDTRIQGCSVFYIKWHSSVGSLYLWICRSIIMFLKVRWRVLVHAHLILIVEINFHTDGTYLQVQFENTSFPTPSSVLDVVSHNFCWIDKNSGALF